ncbi:MAG: sugar ABC transporter permease [Armatimonadetes bacterium]|nr:sugar ABC transporter permease [Armatimonadota bacterium]
MKQREELKGVLYCLPFLLSFLVFTVWPLLYCLHLVFYRWNLGGAPHFVGLKYIFRMFQDETYLHAWQNTLGFVFLNVPLQIVLGLCLAVALNKKIKAREWFRGCYFFPVIISGSVTTILWLYLLNQEQGLVNQFLSGFLHLPRVPWLTGESFVIASLALHATWKNLGLTVVLLLAGLQSIPGSIYEAAELDGARGWLRFWKITLPLLNPAFVMVVLLCTMGAFSLFVEPLVMTNFGGPGDASMSLYLYIYKKFAFWDMSYAATLGLATAAGVLLVVRLQKRLLEQDVG